MRLNAYSGVFVVKEIRSGSAQTARVFDGRRHRTDSGVLTGDGTPEEAYRANQSIGVTSLSQRDCATQPAGTCPEVVILDQPIAKNPEIDGVEGASGVMPVAQEKLCTDPADPRSFEISLNPHGGHHCQ